MIKNLFLALLFVSCSSPSTKNDNSNEIKDREIKRHSDSLARIDSEEKKTEIVINDTLNAIARLISGTMDNKGVFASVTKSSAYHDFSESFSGRWKTFDSSRITKLIDFRSKELAKEIKAESTLFYPFSGPDILYPEFFFPDAKRYILIGLEPVGTLPEFNVGQNDSLKKYYNKLNTSLNAILKFSFFRTESMSKDLKNKEVNGTLHLLFLFLNRTGNGIVSARPLSIDSTGHKIYFSSFEELQSAKIKTKGIEIIFKSNEGERKELDYFSLNASDEGLRHNTGFKNYLEGIKNFNTYLKGASYLLHKDHFSIIRNTILNGATTIVQDDSGIAFSYIKKKGKAWNYKLYGNYTKPISMFSNRYQPDLDSLYKKNGSSALGFGIGYNFKDKNSNLMVIKRS